uniref:Steroid 5-alpha reductase C-terminal domain-containing protein n=1 Tax=Neobodo designis TaxID=312471 RepID=A0A7S1QWY3_NEODS
MSFAVVLQPFAELGTCLMSAAPAACAPAAAAPPVVASGILAFGIGVLCYVLSCLTGNDSWVDRLWSIVPPAHMWFYVWYTKTPLFTSTASGTVLPTAYGGYALVATVWGIRLTFNFWRRGGYQPGGEDYRWEHVRSWPVWKNRVLWHLFSFGFISVFQQWLLWAITLPVLSREPRKVAAPVDLGIMVATLTFILIETIADQQQWNFQNEKRDNKPRRAELADDYKRGFLTHGLFARSRHPNVWAEQQIWTTIYAASMITYGPANWFGLGCLALVLLTVRSCALTEQLSAAKYPAYRAYARAVPMLVPATRSTTEPLKASFAKLETKSK